MPITTFIPYTPTTGQWVAIQKLGVFFESDEFQVFVLKGYAGTGKTTLLKGVLDYLDSIKLPSRMKKKGIRPKTENFIRSMQMDKRFNALKVKFGYAITCHKAQGGEWNNVFLNIEPALMNQSRENQYRWMYTAITRAAKQLVLPQHEVIY